MTPTPEEKLWQEQIAVAFSERRGISGEIYGESQRMVHLPVGTFSERLAAEDPDVIAVEPSVESSLGTVPRPSGDVLAAVQFRGQPWCYLVPLTDADQAIDFEYWSDLLACQALEVGHAKSENVLEFRLFEDGREEESFRSNGFRFYTLPKDKPPLSADEQAEVERGTRYESNRWDADSIDWSEYASREHFLNELLQELDACYTFVSGRWAQPDGGIHLKFREPGLADLVERIDLILFEQLATVSGPEHEQTPRPTDPATRALDDAIRTSDLEAARLAVADGANVNAAARGSAYCLLYKASHKFEFLQLLLDAGANPNLGQIESALMGASGRAIPEALQSMALLLQRGADINRRILPLPNQPPIDRPVTALQKAAESLALESVILLLRRGADPTTTNHVRRTARDLCAWKLKSWYEAYGEDGPPPSVAPQYARGQEIVNLLDEVVANHRSVKTLPDLDDLLDAIATGRSPLD